MNISRRKLALSASALAAVGAVAALIAGVTFGLFTSSVAQTTHYVAGTVTLGGSATGSCDINTPPGTDVKPGDTYTCTFNTTYTGNSAYEALDVFVATKAGTGGTNLYNPGGTNGLTIGISDGTTTYTVPTTALTPPCPTVNGIDYSTGGWTCYGMNNELLRSTGSTVTPESFTITVNLPLAAGNIYQGGSADIVLTAHAVQTKNNTIACSGQTAPFTAGATCTPGTGFSW